MSVYTAGSPIVGTGVALPTTIDAWFTKFGYCPPGLGQQVTLNAALAGLNSDLLAAQIAHETGYWTSAIAKDKLNPAGIGAENDDPYNKAITFPTIAAGILAMVDHLLTYIKGDGPWTAQDPRYAAVKAEGWLGSVRVLSDLDGKWAYPGQGYGASIAALANALCAFAQQTGGAPVTQSDDPRFAWRPDGSEYGYPQGQYGRSGYGIELAVNHFTDGSDSLQWLLDNHGSSSHYLTDKAGKPRAQMIIEADAAWTGGSKEYNCRGVHLEFEKLAGDPWTDAEVQELARTWAPIAQRNNIPPVYLGHDNAQGKRGFIGHRDIPDPYNPGQWGGSDHHADPGGPPNGGPEFPWDAFIGYLKQVLAGLPSTDVGGNVTNSTDPLVLEGNPFGPVPIVRGFKDYVLQQAQARFPANTTAGILSIYGWPKAAEYADGNGHAWQVFEKAVLHYTPNTPAPYDIQQNQYGEAPPAKAQP